MNNNQQIIHQFLQQVGQDLSDSSKQLLSALLRVVEFPKKHVVITEGQQANKLYYIIQGASRSFYIQNGVEVHTWFAFENELIGSFRNYNNLESKETIELLEDSILIELPIVELKELAQKNLELALFVQHAILEYTSFLEDRLFELHMNSAQNKYEALLNHEPELFQRVPLTYIASYLGVSRETLSRIRAK